MIGTQFRMHDAVFSPNRTYRYWLGAKLSDDDGVCMFLMLNPSTADEVTSDRTLNACKRFARGWRYGILWVCNLFALRSPYPGELAGCGDPVGRGNDGHILRRARSADTVMCAWGNHGARLNRAAQVLQLLERAGLSSKMCHLGMTKMAQPRHPLRLKAHTRPIHFTNRIRDIRE